MDDLQKQRAANLHDQGKGRNEIARELGVAPALITAWAHREGRSFDRRMTVAATRARVIDGAERRQVITGRIYEMLERTLDRAEYAPEGGWKTVIRSQGGGEVIVSVEELPLRDLRDLGATVNTLSYAVAALERANATFRDQSDLEHAQSLFAQMGRALGIMPPVDN